MYVPALTDITQPCRVWGYGSVGKALAAKHAGGEFRSPEPV